MLIKIFTCRGRLELILVFLFWGGDCYSEIMFLHTAAFVEAFLLGLIGGAVPGPILTGTFTEILRSGFSKGVRVVLYALFAETIGAISVVVLFDRIGLNQTTIQIISVIGAMVLFWLGYQVWRITEVEAKSGQILTLPKIFLLTAFNTGYWIFWVTVGVPKALLLSQTLYAGKYIFLSIFEIAWLIATLLLAFIFYQFRPLLQRRGLIGTTYKVLAGVLVLLGLKTLLTAFL